MFIIAQRSIFQITHALESLPENPNIPVISVLASTDDLEILQVPGMTGNFGLKQDIFFSFSEIFCILFKPSVLADLVSDVAPLGEIGKHCIFTSRGRQKSSFPSWTLLTSRE